MTSFYAETFDEPDTPKWIGSFLKVKTTGTQKRDSSKT
jgi:hypothetical protein